VRCDQCSYFVKDSDEPTGDCYRFPPALVGPPDEYGSYEAWIHPKVGVSNFCGEFKPKDHDEIPKERPAAQDEVPPTLERIEYAARWIPVPARWLKAEAQAGRIPHLVVEKRIFVNLEAVTKALAERASKEGIIPKEKLTTR